MGVVGIQIHELQDSEAHALPKGRNPFDIIGYGNAGKKFSPIVECYDRKGRNGRERYAWIGRHLSHALEEAFSICRDNG